MRAWVELEHDHVIRQHAPAGLRRQLVFGGQAGAPYLVQVITVGRSMPVRVRISAS